MSTSHYCFGEACSGTGTADPSLCNVWAPGFLDGHNQLGKISPYKEYLQEELAKHWVIQTTKQMFFGIPLDQIVFGRRS